MRKFLLIVVALMAVCAAVRATAQDDVRVKAAHFFDTKEWLNANALYLTAIEANPTDPSVFARAIVSAAMSGDMPGAVHLFGQAAEHSVDTSELWRLVRSDSFAAGSPTLYATLLGDVRTAYPWMARAIDRALLDYYAFRNNGPELVSYAQSMLAGMPDNVEFQRLLARGYLLDGRTQMALDTWQSILDAHPDQLNTLIDMGNCLMLTGQTAKGRALLERANALHPTPYLEVKVASLPG